MTNEREAPVDRSISRRTIIRNAAAVGAAAWTAPVIVDSLASPAAAGSATGCYRVEFVRSTSSGCGTFARNSPAGNGAGCFNPSTWNNLPDYPGTVSLTPSLPPGGPCLYTLEISGSSGCVIDSRSTARQDMANKCSPGTLADGCHTMFFSPGFTPDRFKILIGCGGTVCTGGAPCPPSP
jgi:hypothetical protein